MPKAQWTQGIEYFKSFNNSSQQKLQQALKIHEQSEEICLALAFLDIPMKRVDIGQSADLRYVKAQNMHRYTKAVLYTVWSFVDNQSSQLIFY